MAQTIRHYWGAFQGRTELNYNYPTINWDSVVLVTVSEYKSQDPPTTDYRFIGDASITVENVAPHGPPYDPNHGVTFVVNVDWGSPLQIVTDIIILPNPPIFVDYPSNISATQIERATHTAVATKPATGPNAPSIGLPLDNIVAEVTVSRPLSGDII